MRRFGTRTQGVRKKNVGFRLHKLFVAMVLAIFCVCSVNLAFAEDKSVAEKILDILRQNNQITDAQYSELLKQAKAEKAPGTNLMVYWKNGLRIKSADNRYKIKIGGRLQSDFAVIGADDDLDRLFPSFEGHGSEFRRARIQIAGTVYENVAFKWQYDFASGSVHFKNVWIELKHIPYVGKFRVGHFKEPFSLEELTCSKYLTFLERALPNTFAAGYNTGFMLHNAEFNKRMTWAVGLFFDTDGQGKSFNNFSDTDLTARITVLPWLAENGRKLLHLGFSYSHRFRDDNGGNPIRFRERPEAHLSTVRLVDTGNIIADDVDLFNPEMVLIYGPLSIQAEYMYASVNSVTGSDPNFSGYYAYISYFLTGEHRHYVRSSGHFCRLTPNRNFDFGKSGWGAWELVARYSYVDLDDNGIQGGKENDVTLGANWYLNPNVRVMFNYVNANVDRKDLNLDNGNANIFEARFQIEF
ncbi:Phosphate-specific outer membrane porin OprP [Dissulfuribacter thermophilus]|uniref:Phosphate-specific outer membrane porin OprP n=1 Tax=Dissulfuribacter thermophilus TaxID=1156395 RepID=A0A1B9F2W7_9BACT|nr:porin [Dissulfuribacter thermophilus]OCC14174.1 Phosphate-specific outer membrane porin OprP [Dissulfuribacter thermophilus]